MRPVAGVRAPKFVFAGELLHLTEQRPNSLTVVFDQSVGRGSEERQLDVKLRGLRDQGAFGFAYISHACFIVLGRDRALIEQALEAVIRESRLPESRFVSSS
jgi:hypothetical protein